MLGPSNRTIESRLPGLAALLALQACGPGAPAGTAEPATATAEPAIASTAAVPEQPPGESRATATDLAAEIRALEALGYAGASPGVDSGETGVVAYDRERAAPGWNLLTSGHGPEAVLYDMAGNPLHTWRKALDEVWPGRKPTFRSVPEAWRRVRLEPDGSLFAIFEGLGLIKLDRDSNLIWAHDGLAHHALDVAPDGRVYVLTRRAALLPRFNEEHPILEDFVTILSSEGQPLESISLLECLERSGPPEAMEIVRKGGDVFHTNALKLLREDRTEVHPEFRAGRVMISILRSNLLAVVDLEERACVWSLAGDWRRQHEPSLLEGGHLLLFDNRGLRRRSRVLELVPATGEVVWSYQQEARDAFYSASCGSCQRLPGGNTLITETEAGRAFEVTPAGELVWDFRNPFRAGEQGELTAWVFELERLPPDFPLDWLE